MTVWGLSLYRQWHRSQWPRGLRCVPTKARFLRPRVRILPGTWGPECVLSVLCCQVEVCDGLIPRNPAECLRVSLNIMRRNNNSVHLQWVGRGNQNKKRKIIFLSQIIITQQEKTQIFRVLLPIVLSPLGADSIFNLKCVTIVPLTKDYIISNTRRRETSTQ